MREAMNALAGEYLGTRWRKLNTCNNVVWFVCTGCELRCKIVLNRLNDIATVHIDEGFLNSNRQHQHEQKDEDKAYGLPQRYIDRIKELRALG